MIYCLHLQFLQLHQFLLLGENLWYQQPSNRPAAEMHGTLTDEVMAKTEG